MIYANTGYSNKDLETLNKVLSLSSAGPYIRPYLEFGEPMKQLLIVVNKEGKYSNHIAYILKHFEENHRLNGKVNLSNREKEVLALSHEFTNKEVGNKLFIAEKTVKNHITSINKKLKATSKKESLNKAKELGIL